MNYEKRYINDNNDYHIYFIYDDGREQKVLENQDLYQAWLTEGNTPTEIPYVAPEIIIPSVEKQKLNLYESYITYRRNQIDDAGLAVIVIKSNNDSNKVKSKADKDYFEILWQDYKTRYNAVTDEIDSNYDFSNNGNMPYTFEDIYNEAD
jgi:hypothetical protein